MGNVLFAYPNNIDAAVYPVAFSGGSWEATLPLSNLRDPILSKVARSTDAALASTTFDVDLGLDNLYGRVISFPRHTISTAGRVRARGSTSSTNFGKGQRWLASTAGANRQLTVTYTGNAVKTVSVYVRVSTSLTPSTSFQVIVRDTTASAIRLNATFTLTAGVPNSPTPATGTLQGVDAATTEGWYRLKLVTTSVTAANGHRIEIYPSGAGSGTEIEIYGVMTENAATASTYSDTAPNLVSAPTDLSGWTASGTTTLTLAGTDEPGGEQTLDTGWTDAWPVAFSSGVLPWGHPNLWTLKYTAEQAAAMRGAWVYAAPAAVQARYWRLEIDDTTNAAGYLDIARCVISPAFEPSLNAKLGAQFGLNTTTRYEESLGGARFFDRQYNRRQMLFSFDDLPEDELLTTFLEMQRDLDLDGQVFVLWDSADTIHLQRRSMLANLRELSAIEMAYYGRGTLPVALEEVL